MEQTAEKKEQGRFDRIPLVLRNRFQMLVIKELNIEEDIDKIQNISKILSDIIDNVENIEIRQKIFEEKFDEAVVMVLELLKDKIL